MFMKGGVVGKVEWGRFLLIICIYWERFSIKNDFS